MSNRLQKLWQRTRTKSGATLVEYAIILVLVSIVAVLVLHGIGASTNNMVSSINNGFGP